MSRAGECLGLALVPTSVLGMVVTLRRQESRVALRSLLWFGGPFDLLYQRRRRQLHSPHVWKSGRRASLETSTFGTPGSECSLNPSGESEDRTNIEDTA